MNRPFRVSRLITLTLSLTSLSALAHTGLTVRTPETIDGGTLRALIRDLEALSDLISSTYLR